MYTEDYYKYYFLNTFKILITVKVDKYRLRPLINSQ